MSAVCDFFNLTGAGLAFQIQLGPNFIATNCGIIIRKSSTTVVDNETSRTCCKKEKNQLPNLFKLRIDLMQISKSDFRWPSKC
jgi:hypothetical protein